MAPTLGAMIAAIGSPAEWGAVNTAYLSWNNSTNTLSATNFSGALTGNAATATALIGNETNWTDYRTRTVANMLSWKNYGSGHVIFDASNSTAPDGHAISHTTAEVAWSATYPTLMGWNGSSTYGVRVDVCRLADAATNCNNASSNHFAVGCYYPTNQSSYFLYCDSGNTGLRTNGNFLVDGDIYWGNAGWWLSSAFNQYVKTTSNVSFGTIHGSELHSSGRVTADEYCHAIYFYMSGTYAGGGTAVQRNDNGYLYLPTSSERFKKDIVRRWSPTNFMDFLMVSPIQFSYKSDETGKAPPTKDDPVDPKFIGFSAEEIDDMGLLGMINYDSEKKPFSLRDHGLMVYHHLILQNLNERLIQLEKGV